MHCRRRSQRYVMIHETLASKAKELQMSKMVGVVAKQRWCPATDIYETVEAVYITIEIAGVDPEQFEISLYDDALVIEGKRQIQVPKHGVYHIAEIQQGPFCFELPLFVPVDPNHVDINYEDGILSIILKKFHG